MSPVVSKWESIGAETSLVEGVPGITEDRGEASVAVLQAAGGRARVEFTRTAGPGDRVPRGPQTIVGKLA